MSLTLVTAWTKARKALEAAGVESPVLDARMLLEVAVGVTRSAIVTDPYRPVPDEAAATLDALVARRAAREPLAHIIGRKGFWTLDLIVSPAVLTPRPDTETLVDLVVKARAGWPKQRVLDLGAGSGAIILALLSSWDDAEGVAIDASTDALEIARENAARIGLSERCAFVHADWTGPLALDARPGLFDVIVSNPPYIASAEIDGLEPEVVRHEPRLALDGGADGLDAYRQIAPLIASMLKPNGLWAVEVGRGQADQVRGIAEAAGLMVNAITLDLNGVARVVSGGQVSGGR
jgi:release factor glutamine methyltransferase